MPANPHQPDLFARFCPPSSEPLEGWMLRLLSSDLNVSTKLLGCALGLHVQLHGNPYQWRHTNLWKVLGFNPKSRHHGHTLWRYLEKLEQRGYARRTIVHKAKINERGETVVVPIIQEITVVFGEGC